MHACLWKEQCRFPSYLLGQDQAAAVQGGLLAHSCTHNAAVQADCPSPLLFPVELSLIRCMSFSWNFSWFFVCFAFFVCFRGFRGFFVSWAMSCRLATHRLLCQCRIAWQLAGCFLNANASAAVAAAARTRRCAHALKQRLRTFEKFSVESKLEVLEDGVDGAVLLVDGSLQGTDLPVFGDHDAVERVSIARSYELVQLGDCYVGTCLRYSIIRLANCSSSSS